VMFVVVRNEVHQCKAVVTGHKINAVKWGSPVDLIEVRTSRHASGQHWHHVGIAFHEAADVVAELTVPFCPPTPIWKGPHLIKSRSVPGFGYELRVREDWIASDGFQKRRVRQYRAVGSPPKNGRKVESESVDVHLGYPISEAVKNQPTNHRMI